MKDNSVCIKCGGTGIDALGNPCSCGINKKIEMPVCLKVPMQYQGLKFNKAFIREGLPPLYGETLDKILQDCIDSFGQFKRNILICAPPGSSKTIWAYTLYSMLFSMGCEIPEIMDLMQCREILLNYYTEDKEALRLLSIAPLAVIKIPWDLPNRFVETMFSFLDFHEVEEMRRVINQMVSWGTSAPMSEKKPYKVVDGYDGSRRTAIRPGAGESWAIFIRKFNLSVHSVKWLLDKVDNQLYCIGRIYEVGLSKYKHIIESIQHSIRDFETCKYESY